MTVVVLSIEVSARETSKQIRTFAGLPDGWHYGTGVGATSGAVEAATEANSIFFLYGAEETEAFPDVDGGILVSGYHNEATVEALCRPHGAIDVTMEVGDQITYEQTGLSVQNFKNFMKELSWSPTNASAYYTHNTSVEGNSGSQALRFGNLPREAYRYLTLNVLAREANPYVAISKNTMEMSQGIRLYSGRSTSVPFRMDVKSPMKSRQPAMSATVTFVG